jgi:hypothetical protein
MNGFLAQGIINDCLRMCLCEHGLIVELASPNVIATYVPAVFCWAYQKYRLEGVQIKSDFADEEGMSV